MLGSKTVASSGVLFLMLLSAGSDLALANGGSTPPGEIKIVAKRFKFSPKTITVQRGEKVRLAVTSEDVDHGIAILEFGVDVKVPANRTRIVEFTPTREGRFRFTCSGRRFT